MTIMPPVSQTNSEVGSVASPGCSKTIPGLFRSPRQSQIALPNARAPLAQGPHSGLLVSGIGEGLAANDADGTFIQTELTLVLVGDNGNRLAAVCSDDLDGNAT